jgi:DNA-directed RNA polymerase subunit RPC12/RpoP
MNCPRCHRAELAYDEQIGKMRCPACGFRLFQDSLTDQRPVCHEEVRPAPPAKRPSSPGKRPPVPISAPGGLNTQNLPALGEFEAVRMAGRCQEAMYCLARGDQDGARRALRLALEISADFPEAWLMLAGLAEDADEQRVCLEHVIASDPGNPVAIEALARLDGRLTDAAPAPAAPTGHAETGPVAGRRIVCPQCGGALEYQLRAREVVCHFCGHHILNLAEMPRSDRHETLVEGLVRRKGQSVEWNIGARWVRCAECGAITTLAQRTLSDVCRFCGSQQVLQESVSLHFEQPDLIVPFAIDEAGARDSIQRALRSGLRMITRFFADAIEQVEVAGIYLPFWVFDADMIVHWSWTNAPDRGEHPILLSDVPYLAASGLSRTLCDKIEPFDLRQGADYDPRLLAAFPAQLYDLDVAQASIDVRTKLSRQAQDRARLSLEAHRPSRGYGGYGKDDDPGSLRTHASTQFITYRLALLPVWIARLTEEDGDIRIALVNGQNGRAALGGIEKKS